MSLIKQGEASVCFFKKGDYNWQYMCWHHPNYLNLLIIVLHITVAQVQPEDAYVLLMVRFADEYWWQLRPVANVCHLFGKSAFQFRKLAFLSGWERGVIVSGIMIRVLCVVKVRSRDMIYFISVHLSVFLVSSGLLCSVLTERSSPLFPHGTFTVALYFTCSFYVNGLIDLFCFSWVSPYVVLI